MQAHIPYRYAISQAASSKEMYQIQTWFNTIGKMIIFKKLLGPSIRQTLAVASIKTCTWSQAVQAAQTYKQGKELIEAVYS